MEGVFKISSDEDRAKSILELAEERQDMIKIYPREKAYKIVEEYYEIIKELMTSLMYLEGYKTLSHVKLIDFIGEKFNLESTEIKFIHKLRKFRNNSMYYGKKIGKNFLINNEDRIKDIINTINKIIKDRLGN